jgi:hypothetical protein
VNRPAPEDALERRRSLREGVVGEPEPEPLELALLLLLPEAPEFYGGEERVTGWYRKGDLD